MTWCQYLWQSRSEALQNRLQKSPQQRNELEQSFIAPYDTINKIKTMQLTVKTLKGGKFTIEVEPSNTVAEAKAVIVSRVVMK